MRSDTGIASNAKQAKLLQQVREQFTEQDWDQIGDVLEQSLGIWQEDRSARTAFERLINAGCNPAVLVHQASLFCREEWDPDLQKRAKHATSELKKTAVELKQGADIVERIANEFLSGDDGPYIETFHSPRLLRQIADSLLNARNELVRRTHGKTGTTKYLVYLCYHVKAAAGRPHYKEIAELIACLRGEAIGNIVLSADAIRRVIRRHEKQDSEFFKEERKAIECSLEDWRRWIESGMPSTRTS
jgi:hypothetical protein